MSKNPVPQGKYKPAVRHGNLVFTAGMTPRKDGALLMSGKISPNEPIETYTTHAKIGDVVSEYLFEQLGDAGIGPRAALGMATLPGNAPVEVQMIAAIG